jgi:hypothetical protein
VHLVGLLKCLTFAVIFMMPSFSFVSFDGFNDASKFLIVLRNRVMTHFPQVQTVVHSSLCCNYNVIAQKILSLRFQQKPVRSKSANLFVSDNVFL